MKLFEFSMLLLYFFIYLFFIFKFYWPYAFDGFLCEQSGKLKADTLDHEHITLVLNSLGELCTISCLFYDLF